MRSTKFHADLSATYHRIFGQIFRTRQFIFLVCFAATALSGFIARADSGGAATLPRNDGPAYAVSSISLVIPTGIGEFPTEADFDRLQIVFADAPGGFGVPATLEKEYRTTQLHDTSASTPWPSASDTIVRLGDIGKNGVVQIHVSGLWAMERQIAAALNSGDEFGGKQFIGVFVGTQESEIGADMSDKRSGSTGLHLVIQLGRVSEVRTIAYGDRLGLTDRVNNPVHLSIRANSPVGPASQPASETSVLRKDLIDNYTFFLDRHPGRRVDVAVSAGPAPEVGQPPTVTLDYLVTEAKPWYVYANYSNTGTRQTEAWRTKFGFVDNELTNNDDIFSIDYDFASVNTSEEVTSSYELPVSSDGRVRARIYGLADKYVASDVGLANEDFRGTEQMFGSEAIWNFLQYKQLFVDMFGGGRYQHFKVDQEVSGGSAIATGSAAYAVPYAGLRLVRSTDPMTTVADVTVLGGFSERGKDELAELGRLDPTKDWLLLQSDVNQSFYLEPIAKALGLPTKDGSLANEVAFYGRYQEAFGARLVPQFEQTAGGFYTVRGYQESATAGDRVFIGTAEYRFHLPRYLDLQPTPGTLFGQPFRYAPQQAFGPTDWDLIFRAFVDAARVEQDNRQSYESDDTLVSTGVGLELQVKQNLDIRADWGIALKGISDGTEAGSNRFHLSFTLLY